MLESSLASLVLQATSNQDIFKRMLMQFDCVVKTFELLIEENFWKYSSPPQEMSVATTTFKLSRILLGNTDQVCEARWNTTTT
jgi:hypothetical protein